jgi:hypothetical protein
MQIFGAVQVLSANDFTQASLDVLLDYIAQTFAANSQTQLVLGADEWQQMTTKDMRWEIA